jgi:hypothetical protein
MPAWDRCAGRAARRPWPEGIEKNWMSPSSCGMDGTTPAKPGRHVCKGATARRAEPARTIEVAPITLEF